MTQRDNFLHLFVSKVESSEKQCFDVSYACGEMEGMKDLAYAMDLITEEEWNRLGSELLYVDEENGMSGLTEKVKAILNY